MNNKKEVKLINKVKRLLKKAGIPRYLHHYGPKKYEFYNHALAHLVRQECRLGYRRVTRLLRGLGIKCPCSSALCTNLHKIPLNLLKIIFAATTSSKINLVALDGTGLTRPLPSPNYYRRIDKPYPIDIHLKLSIAVDTRSKKILALRLRASRAHDVRDAKYIINHLPRKPSKIVADKGYDANWLHMYCVAKGIKTCIPMRDYGKTNPANPRKTLRKRLAKKFTKRTYGRRNIVESVFKVLNTRFGSSVSSVKFSAQRAEVYCRAIAYNVLLINLYFLNAPTSIQTFKYNLLAHFISPRE